MSLHPKLRNLQVRFQQLQSLIPIHHLLPWKSEIYYTVPQKASLGSPTECGPHSAHSRNLDHYFGWWLNYGIPCFLATLVVTNNYATYYPFVVNGWIKGMKCPYFARPIDTQTTNRIGKGCSRPAGKCDAGRYHKQPHNLAHYALTPTRRKTGWS